MTASNVFARLAAATQEHNTVVCCGLDPDTSRFPDSLRRRADTTEVVYDFLSEVVEITQPFVCAYKIQKAYFESYLDGLRLLRDVVAMIRAKAPHAIVMLDAKLGDIAHTMEAYCHAYFTITDADVLVLNPYMGADVWSAIAAYPNRAAAVVVRSSNPKASQIQDLLTEDRLPLWRHVLRLLLVEREGVPNMFPILSTDAVSSGGCSARAGVPDDVPIFIAGVGAQGGDLRAIRHFVNAAGGGVAVNSSRALLYPYAAADPNWKGAIYAATAQFRDRCNRERGA